MAHKIKLMTDYNCYPLWWTNGRVGDINPNTLPLNQKTIQSLEAWANVYDNILNWDDPASSGFASLEDKEAFEQEGINLWLQLREELSPNYQVIYKSELLQEFFADPQELEKSSLVLNPKILKMLEKARSILKKSTIFR